MSMRTNEIRSRSWVFNFWGILTSGTFKCPGFVAETSRLVWRSGLVSAECTSCCQDYRPDLGYPWFTSTLEKAWYTPPPSVPPDLGHYLSQNNVRAARITSPGETSARCGSTPSFPPETDWLLIPSRPPETPATADRPTVLLENNDRDSSGSVN